MKLLNDSLNLYVMLIQKFPDADLSDSAIFSHTTMKKLFSNLFGLLLRICPICVLRLNRYSLYWKKQTICHLNEFDAELVL